MRPRLSRILCALLLSAAWPVCAQPPAGLQPLPEPPPPPPLSGDAAFEPQVTIRQQGDDKVEEYRVNGQLYMLKVTPPHGTPYYLVDRKGDGSFVRVEAVGSDRALVVPQWVIKRF